MENEYTCLNCGDNFLSPKRTKTCGENCLSQYMSKKYKGKHLSETTKIRMKGRPSWNKGKTKKEDNRVAQPWLGKKRPENSGEHNNKWKGGVNHSQGYVYVTNKEHPFANFNGYVKRSRLVMELHIGRYLLPEEVVHHIDKNRSNDHLNNLMLFPNNGAHLRFHFKKRIDSKKDNK